MKTAVRWVLLAGLFVCAGVARADPALSADLVQVGKSYVTAAKIRAGDSVRVRVREKGDGMQDAIVIAAFTPAQARLTREPEAGVELQRWGKQEVEPGQVLVYTLKEAAHVGVGLAGSSNSRQAVVRRADYFELRFWSITERWVLEVRFTTPDF